MLSLFSKLFCKDRVSKAKSISCIPKEGLIALYRITVTNIFYKGYNSCLNWDEDSDLEYVSYRDSKFSILENKLKNSIFCRSVEDMLNPLSFLTNKQFSVFDPKGDVLNPVPKAIPVYKNVKFGILEANSPDSDIVVHILKQDISKIKHFIASRSTSGIEYLREADVFRVFCLAKDSSIFYNEKTLVKTLDLISVETNTLEPTV